MSNITELVFIIDCSKATGGCEFEIVSSINGIINSYRKKAGTIYINTITFNSTAKMLHDRLKIETVKTLTIADVKAEGDTALHDTIAAVINHLRNIHHYIRTEDIPDQTLFYIFSSGVDNASIKYTYSEIKRMIDDSRKNYGWQFSFEKENIYATGKKVINASNNSNYNTAISDDDFKILMEILNKGKQ